MNEYFTKVLNDIFANISKILTLNEKKVKKNFNLNFDYEKVTPKKHIRFLTVFRFRPRKS